MQGKALSVSQLKDIASLLMKGRSCSEIARTLRVSRPAISNIKFILIKNLITSNEALDKLTEEALVKLIYPTAVITADYQTGDTQVELLRVADGQCYYPDFMNLGFKVVEEKKVITNLYFDYQEQCQKKNKNELSRSVFFAKVKEAIDDITRGDDASITLNHEYGHDVQIDYIDKYPVLTLNDKTKRQFVVFVMVWPASYYTYACYIPKHSTAWTCKAIGDGYQFFGVKSRCICPDNAKAMIIEHCKGQEAVINTSFDDYMERFGIDIMPTPVYSGSSKSAVEFENLLIEERVFPQIDHDTPHTLSEHNALLMKEVNHRINRTRLHHSGKTREELFLLYEKPAAKPMNMSAPDYVEITKSVRVQRNYMVRYKKHSYSVPHNFINLYVDIHATADSIKVYYKDRMISVHSRSDDDDGFSINRSHMPEHHQAVVFNTGKFTTDDEIRKACEGHDTLLAFCLHRLSFKDAQRYEACSAVIRAYLREVNQKIFDEVLREFSLVTDKLKCTTTNIKNTLSQRIKLLEQQQDEESEQKDGEDAFASRTPSELEIQASGADVYRTDRKFSKTITYTQDNATAQLS